ncbi:hypothetical protein G5714_007784 [Onychostoma macrolepis]|uniref:Putative nuclease HARBI1 n=1 Tax=Onychostoma macrolepis TaxID=369639 RepID=A0A7J6CW26_9TELE|nr:hypothetical protein G5714_007784 [Onychostoma macrolepis]
MAARPRIVVLNQKRQSQLVYVHYFIRENFSPLATMSEDNILQRFRLPQEQIQQLLHLIGPTLSRQTRRRYPMSPEIQLLSIFILWGVFWSPGLGINKGGLDYSPTNYIRMPFARHEVMEAHQGFHAIAGVPQVIGLVDRTLIPIANPSALDQAFICRKGFAAINVQVVVDHRGMFTDMVAKWPGSTHDSFVWANSAAGQDAERGVLGRPFFLGDSGYPLRTYLLNPVTNPTRLNTVTTLHTPVPATWWNARLEEDCV